MDTLRRERMWGPLARTSVSTSSTSHPRLPSPQGVSYRAWGHGKLLPDVEEDCPDSRRPLGRNQSDCTLALRVWTLSFNYSLHLLNFNLLLL